MDIERAEEMLSEIAEKCHKEVMDGKNSRGSKAAFDMQERAINMLLKVRKEIKKASNTDLNMHLAFLGLIGSTLNRALVWDQYLQFCDAHNVKPQLKGVLYRTLEVHQFQIKKRGGNMVVVPPKSLSYEVQRHTTALLESEVGSDSGNSRDSPEAGLIEVES